MIERNRVTKHSLSLCVCVFFFWGWFSGEYRRITQAGGFVELGRVNGNLALSRAVGDFYFKRNAQLSPEKQIVTGKAKKTDNEFNADLFFCLIVCS